MKQIKENEAINILVNKNMKLIKETKQYSIYKGKYITIKVFTNNGEFTKGIIC